VVNLGNPVLSDTSFGWLFNALFLAMSRNVIIDTSLTSDFANIPALEQLGLSVAVNFKNLFNETLTYTLPPSPLTEPPLAQGRILHVSCVLICLPLRLCNSNARFIVWVAAGLEVLDPIPAPCTLVNNAQAIAAPSSTYINASYLDCTPASGTLLGFLNLPLNISVFIRDVKITQRVREACHRARVIVRACV
jgi:hypothetical protein